MANQMSRYVKRPLGEPLEVSRCLTDGALVCENERSFSHHLGHHIEQPVKVKYLEKMLIWLRIIR